MKQDAYQKVTAAQLSSMAATLQAQILKADARVAQRIPGSTVFTSTGGNSIMIDDHFIMPDALRKVHLAARALHIIMPVAGAMMLPATNSLVQPGELYCYCAAEAAEMLIRNPFGDTSINLLHITVQEGAHNINATGARMEAVTIDRKNQLVRGTGMAACLRVGLYDSRMKDVAIMAGDSNVLLSYIINGSFEFEERLLEHRDGLYQWDVSSVDYEALSEAALIMLVECSL